MGSLILGHRSTGHHQRYFCVATFTQHFRKSKMAAKFLLCLVLLAVVVPPQVAGQFVDPFCTFVDFWNALFDCPSEPTIFCVISALLTNLFGCDIVPLETSHTHMQYS